MAIILTYLLTYYAVGLTPVQTLELNSLSNKLRDLEKRFEQLVASRKQEDGKQLQLVELQKQVELIHIPGIDPHSRRGGVDPAQRDETESGIPRCSTSAVARG